MTERVRAERVFTRIALGDIVHDAKGRTWVFVGWSSNTVGKGMSFFKAYVAGEPGTPFLYRGYNASFGDTLLAKFSDLARFAS